MKGLGIKLTGLWCLAILLAITGLGQLPLRDWDESIVARVALETSGRPWPDLLFPLYWGEPYLNKPPGLHLLIAAAIGLWRWNGGLEPAALPPEWLLRLGPALLSSSVVPLVGLVQARLRPNQPAVALATSAMALTLLPLARHGRLVMLDGAQLAAILVIWWAVLTPHQQRPSLGLHGALMGLGTSALLLLKAPLAVPILGGTLALRALDRELKGRHWLWLLAGLAVGLLPGLAWHGAHGLVRGAGALEMWAAQGFARVHQGLEGHSGGVLMPITEVLEGGWPWLALWPGALGLAWRDRHHRAGRWCLGTTAITAALVLPLRTQLPWYSQLLWPPFLLTCGPVLVWLVNRESRLKPAWARVAQNVPAFWALLGALLCLFGMAGIVTDHPAIGPLAPVAAVGGGGLLVGGGLLLARGEPQRKTGMILLVAGLWGALLLLMNSSYWLWELNETWPVRAVAQVVREASGEPAHLFELEERPSLNWYAGRRLQPLPPDGLAALQGGRETLLIRAEPTPPQIPGIRCSALPLFEPGPPPAQQGTIFRCGARRKGASAIHSGRLPELSRANLKSW